MGHKGKLFVHQEYLSLSLFYKEKSQEAAKWGKRKRAISAICAKQPVSHVLPFSGLSDSVEMYQVGTTNSWPSYLPSERGQSWSRFQRRLYIWRESLPKCTIACPTDEGYCIVKLSLVDSFLSTVQPYNYHSADCGHSWLLQSRVSKPRVPSATWYLLDHFVPLCKADTVPAILPIHWSGYSKFHGLRHTRHSLSREKDGTNFRRKRITTASSLFL